MISYSVSNDKRKASTKKQETLLFWQSIVITIFNLFFTSEVVSTCNGENEEDTRERMSWPVIFSACSLYLWLMKPFEPLSHRLKVSSFLPDKSLKNELFSQLRLHTISFIKCEPSLTACIIEAFLHHCLSAPLLRKHLSVFSGGCLSHQRHLVTFTEYR